MTLKCDPEAPWLGWKALSERYAGLSRGTIKRLIREDRWPRPQGLLPGKGGRVAFSAPRCDAAFRVLLDAAIAAKAATKAAEEATS